MGEPYSFQYPRSTPAREFRDRAEAARSPTARHVTDEARERMDVLLVAADIAERLTAEAQRFFNGDPFRRFAKDDIYPAIFDFVTGDKRLLLQALDRGSSTGKLPRYTSSVIENIPKRIPKATNEHARGLRDFRIITDIMKALNPFLELQGMLLLNVRSAKKEQVLGLARVHEKFEHGSEPNRLTIYSVDVLRPLVFPQTLHGAFDNYLQFSWADRFASMFHAHELRCMGMRATPLTHLQSSTQQARQFIDVTPLADALHGITLIEETQHQRHHHLRRSIKNIADACQQRIVFTHRRLRTEHVLSSVWEHAKTREEKLHVARAIEEANAKLATICYGPDPHLAVAYLIDVKDRHDTSLAMPLLFGVNTIDESTPPSSALLDLPAHELRLRAHRALRAAFTHSDDGPFCTVDENGILRPHRDTLPAFARWAASAE